MHWRRKWQPTPVFLPGESQGRGSLVGWRLWGRTESDTTEATWQQQQQHPSVQDGWEDDLHFYELPALSSKVILMLRDFKTPFYAAIICMMISVDSQRL